MVMQNSVTQNSQPRSPNWPPELRKLKEQMREKLQEQLIQAAQTNLNAFVETVMKDEVGQPLRQAGIHKSWHAHIAYCRRIGKQPIIMAPWAHGKTIQLVIAKTLFELGQNRNQRIGIVCNSDANARKRVTAIKTYIERDADYQRVFPDVRPDRKAGWGKAEFYVERDERARSIDPSVFSAGIFSTGIGGRMDGLIIDDPVDLRNAILMPKLRDSVIATITNVWLSRLEPTGWLVYVATAWHGSDCTHYLIRDPEVRDHYCALIQRIDNDYSGIECYLVGGDPGVAYPAVETLG